MVIMVEEREKSKQVELQIKVKFINTKNYNHYYSYLFILLAPFNLYIVERKFFIPEASQGGCMALMGCTRTQAEEICDQLEAKLAKVENDTELELAKLEMNEIDGDAAFHIGITNEVSIK